MLATFYTVRFSNNAQTAAQQTLQNARKSKPISMDKAVQLLKYAGFKLNRTNGHQVFKHADGREISIPVGRSDLSNGIAKQIATMIDNGLYD